MSESLYRKFCRIADNLESLSKTYNEKEIMRVCSEDAKFLRLYSSGLIEARFIEDQPDFPRAPKPIPDDLPPIG